MLRALCLSLCLVAAPVCTEDVCTACANEPERLSGLGAISHGPLTIANTRAEALRERWDGDWIFLETAHFKFASNLRDEPLNAKERKQLAPLLERVRPYVIDLPKKPRKLDPHLRLHLLALRAEDFYARFQKLLGVTDADFPESRQPTGPYMGNGKFLGEKNKFEVVYHLRRHTHLQLGEEFMGARVTDALRWHFSDGHMLLASVPAEDGDLKHDKWLFPHSVHLYSHLFLCAYKHFSYDPPIWLDEGLAHVMEREIEPLSTTQDGDEGSGPHRGGHQDWRGKDVLLAKRGKSTAFAVLMRYKAFHELSQNDHITVWSMVRFLVEEHPEKFAQFLGGLKGQLDDKGYPTGADMVGLQRRLLKETWGWTPAEFDEAWRNWVLGVNEKD